ncbi:MAG TPA: sensor histidine kinase [Anaerolineales bacterium]|jgi:two-component system sensor histidine kinase DegS
MAAEQPNPLEDARKSVQAELDDSSRALRDVTLMLEQSQVEVTKLAQRNVSITTQLQQIHNSQLGSLNPEEMRKAYDSALDAQQRLFVMREQLDKLKSEQLHQQHYRSVLEKLMAMLNKPVEVSTGPSKTAAASIESIVQAQEAERQRLSRQMHDGPAQALSNFILQTEIVMRLMDVDSAQAREELLNLKSSALGTFQKVRNFIFELRPMMLDDLGLSPTIKRYAETFKEQTGMDVTVTVTGQERRLESYVEVMIFRALQELLGNAARHSQGSLVKIIMDMGDSIIRVTVDDNGKGFSTDTLSQGNSLGLNLIRDRVEILGGTFELDSTIGKGSRITLAIPVESV